MNCFKNIDMFYLFHMYSFPKYIMEKITISTHLNDFLGGKVHQLCSNFFSFKSNWYITMCRSSILIVVVVKVISIMYTYKSVKSLIDLNSIFHYFLWTCSVNNLESVIFIVQIVIVYTSPSDNVKKWICGLNYLQNDSLLKKHTL